MIIIKRRFIYLCLFLFACTGAKYEIKRDISSFKPKQEQQTIDIKNPRIFQEIIVQESDYYTADINISIDDIATKPMEEAQN